ncbi:hypothetical protein [Halogranum rubrum]|uniref:Uncharacterized protein n=1 Tax=Halogranum salarium B-1 TaxID=1210908 RepID=J3JEH7_9EURY|nr:hypothetical protein [Halogranum salarium]EJN58376.1 hypothetical protein HSB1_37930 [Halogranum salarium B-1]
MVPSHIEWAGRRPGRLASAVRHVGASIVVLLGLFVTALFVQFVPDGDPRFVLFFVVTLLVGGPFSLLYLWYALRYGENDERQTLYSLLSRLRAGFRLRWLVLAMPVGVFVLYSAVLVPLLLFVYPFVGIGVWVVARVGRTGGTLDTESGVLVRRDEERDERRVEYDLSRLRSFRSVRLGPYVVCLFRYGHDRSLNDPFGVVVPADAFETLRPALRALTERSESDDESTESRTVTPERVVLVGFALTFFGVAAVLATSDVPRAIGLSWFVAAWGLLFVFFAWTA